MARSAYIFQNHRILKIEFKIKAVCFLTLNPVFSSTGLVSSLANQVLNLGGVVYLGLAAGNLIDDDV
jgi:hypothetical protein